MEFSYRLKTIVQQYTAISQGYDVSDMDLKQPTAAGSVLIAMPVVLTPGLKVLSVTDDQGNTYKQVTTAAAACGNRPVNIWYCENCKAGVMELKFHLSGRTKGSINSFIELSEYGDLRRGRRKRCTGQRRNCN